MDDRSTSSVGSDAASRLLPPSDEFVERGLSPAAAALGPGGDNPRRPRSLSPIEIPRTDKSSPYDTDHRRASNKVAPLPSKLGSPFGAKMSVADSDVEYWPATPSTVASPLARIGAKVRDNLMRLFDTSARQKERKESGDIKSVADTLLKRRDSIIDTFLTKLNESTTKADALSPDDAEEKPDPRMLTGAELWEMYRIIDPTWKHKLRWDSFMCLLLLFLAFFTPFEVAFLNPHVFSMPFMINRFADLIFIIDIYLNFHIACPRPGTKQMVYDLWELQGRYLKSGWFQADFVSVIPFDLLMVLDTFGFSESTRSRLRVLRLCKLLRLARVMAYVKMQVKDIRVDYNLLNLIMLTLLLMVFSHWMACLWRLVPQMEHAEVDWLVYFGFDGDDRDMHEVMQTYTVSLYWSVMTFTTIGYGDIVPYTNIERIFDIVAMLIGALVFGYIIGAVGNVVQQRSAKENEYYTTMQNLDDFMSEQRLPTDLQKEIRTYVQRLKLTYDVNTYQHYTSLLSPGLRSKLLVYTNHAWLTKVPHFKNTPRQFCVEIASVLSRHLFVPNETVIRYGSVATEIFFVTKGIAAGNNRLYTVGHLLGSEALVRSQSKRQYTCHAITYLQCSKLQQEELFMILENYPQVKRRFRILAIKAIFREEIMAYCVAYRRVMAARFPELNNMSEQTRMSDLFHKNDRTEHYTWKLEMLFPTTENESKRIRKVARMVKQWISFWRRRKEERTRNLKEERERALSTMTAPQRLAAEANAPIGKWQRGRFVEGAESPVREDSEEKKRSDERKQSYVLPGSALSDLDSPQGSSTWPGASPGPSPTSDHVPQPVSVRERPYTLRPVGGKAARISERPDSEQRAAGLAPEARDAGPAGGDVSPDDASPRRREPSQRDELPLASMSPSQSPSRRPSLIRRDSIVRSLGAFDRGHGLTGYMGPSAAARKASGATELTSQLTAALNDLSTSGAQLAVAGHLAHGYGGGGSGGGLSGMSGLSGVGGQGQRAAAPGLRRARDGPGGISSGSAAQSRRGSLAGNMALPGNSVRRESSVGHTPGRAGAAVVDSGPSRQEIMVMTTLQQIMENQARISLWMNEHETQSQNCIDDISAMNRSLLSLPSSPLDGGDLWERRGFFPSRRSSVSAHPLPPRSPVRRSSPPPPQQPASAEDRAFETWPRTPADPLTRVFVNSPPRQREPAAEVELELEVQAGESAAAAAALERRIEAAAEAQRSPPVRAAPGVGLAVHVFTGATYAGQSATPVEAAAVVSPPRAEAEREGGGGSGMAYM